MLKFLSGYRTYLAAASILAAGIAQIQSGDYSGGIMTIISSDAFILILNGLGLGALRASIEKIILSLSTGSVKGAGIPEMHEFIYLDQDGNGTSAAQFNKLVKESQLLPVMTVK